MNFSVSEDGYERNLCGDNDVYSSYVRNFQKLIEILIIANNQGQFSLDPMPF